MNCVNIKIDGKDYQAFEGQLLTDAAEENGIHIPTLCHFKDMFPPLSSCRVCMSKVNGKFKTACTTKVWDGMEVEVNTPELRDLRSSIVEMLFAEGNHYCPACAKSGDCELQTKGYEMGIAVSRFPHLFEARKKDYKAKNFYIDHSRCIHCGRCVAQVETDDHQKVFYFQKRGHNTFVGMDYINEARLSKEQVFRAMDLCPVGAIIAKERGFAKTFGKRKFDYKSAVKYLEFESLKKHDFKAEESNGRKVVATASLAGCFGCHMSLLDIDEGLLDLVELIEFNKSPLTDVKKFSKRAHIGIIEGGIANSENYENLKLFRENCDVLVALGECAIWGGLPAMRNTVPLEACLEESYLNSMTGDQGKKLIPYHTDIPVISDKVYGIKDAVMIDYFIPGCPPRPNLIWSMVKAILFGTKEKIPYEDLKYD